MADKICKSPMRQVPLSEFKNDLARFLREAEKHEIVITRTETGRSADRLPIGR